MASQTFYDPYYGAGHALVIGINRYERVGPLAFAANDAKAVAEILTSKFGFDEDNITLLIDGEATRAAISKALYGLTDKSTVAPNDRILVFFAGHGHTVTGNRGETGFLVPVDGEPANLGSLIRWSEITGSAELMLAKHVLFLMDACYGGLAVTRRTIPPGSMRLLQDMLQRFSRQVLTAGKADEVVSDGGGTRPNHSIFTSHLLDALDGAASATAGAITANGVMAYVYDKVGNDVFSCQTPHYGFLDGDGDFIFAPVICVASPTETGEELLIQTPSFTPPGGERSEPSATETVKTLLGNPSDKILLDDFVTKQVRHVVQSIGLDRYPVQGQFGNDDFVKRVKSYEEIITDLEATIALLARWASREQLQLIEKIIARVAESDKGQSGTTFMIRLGWYPVILLIYACGIAALSQQRHDALRACLLAPVAIDMYGNRSSPTPVISLAVRAITELHDAFKLLPGLERRHTPRSDHLFQTLQPVLEDLLFLGQSYEALFDQFEIILALTYADMNAGEDLQGVWGPPGRFCWKGRYDGDDPYTNLVAEAQRLGKEWGPFKEGLVRNDPDRFAKLAEQYQSRFSKAFF